MKRMNYGSETPFEVLGSSRGIDNESILFSASSMGAWENGGTAENGFKSLKRFRGLIWHVASSVLRSPFSGAAIFASSRMCPRKKLVRPKRDWIIFASLGGSLCQATSIWAGAM